MIGKRLRILREEKELLQKDVATFLNISTSAYGYYEQGKRSPDTETIKKLADLFDVSTDYLLGRTSIKDSFREKQINLDKYNCKTYRELEDKIRQNLLRHGIISEGESISKDMIEKVFQYGIEAATEIIRLEKEIKKDS